MEGTCDHHLVQLPSPGLQPLQQKRAMLSTGEWGVLGRFRSLGRGLPGKAPDPLVLAVPPVCYVKPIHPLCFLTLYAGSRAPWLGAGVDPGLSCWDKEENSQVNESGFTAVRRLKEEGKKSQPMLRDLHGAAPPGSPSPRPRSSRAPAGFWAGFQLLGGCQQVWCCIRSLARACGTGQRGHPCSALHESGSSEPFIGPCGISETGHGGKIPF